MPVHLRSITGKVDYEVEQVIRDLVLAANQQEVDTTILTEEFRPQITQLAATVGSLGDLARVSKVQSDSITVQGDQITNIISTGVTVSGLPVDNQLAVWVSASAIEGNADFTFDQPAGIFTVRAIPDNWMGMSVVDTGASGFTYLIFGRDTATKFMTVEGYNDTYGASANYLDSNLQGIIRTGSGFTTGMRFIAQAGNIEFVVGGFAFTDKRLVLDEDALELTSGAAAMELRLREPSGGGTNYTGFSAPALAGNIVYTLPIADGNASDVLKTDGAATLAWVDHGGISGLGADDHTQYALLAGRSGGQILTGGTGAGDNLQFISTSNVTKGLIGLGSPPRVIFSDVNGYLAIGGASPTKQLELAETTTATSGTFAEMEVLLTVNPSGVSSQASTVFDLGVFPSSANNITGVIAVLEASIANLNTGTLTDVRSLSLNAFNLSTGTITIASGGIFNVINNSTGAITTVHCGNFLVANNNALGTIGVASGVTVSYTNAGTITTANGVEITIANTGTLTNTHALKIGDITAGTQTNTAFAIHSNDAGALVYLNHMVAIGTLAYPSTGSFGLVFGDGTALASMGSNTAGLFANDDGGTVKMYAIDEADSVALLNYRNIALGGGAAPTLGTIGGSGPTVAAQNSWIEHNIDGTAYWVPAWV